MLNRLIKQFILQLVIIILLIIIGIGALQLFKIKKESERNYYNYTTQVQATKFWHTKTGEIIARTAILRLTTSEINNSKDKEIIKLKEVAKSANIKIRKLEQMLSISADTVFTKEVKIDTVRINNNILVYQDSLTIGDLKLIRQQEPNSLIAKYKIKYNPTLYIYVSWVKEDKWRLKNLFIRRPKTYYVDVITKDKLLNVTNVKAVIKP